MNINEYLPQIIATVFVLLLMPVMKAVTRKLIRQYAVLSRKLESRTSHVIRVFAILINLTIIISIILIWGVDPHNILIAVSSAFAVIGVAMFAQWSLLSNVTAGILVFFTSPFRIGDYVRIHDKDTPIEAEVIDILTFHTHFKTIDGEIIVYPNSLLMQKGISVIDKRDISKEDISSNE